MKPLDGGRLSEAGPGFLFPGLSCMRRVFLPILLFFTGKSALFAQQWQRVDALPSGQTTVLFAAGNTLYAAGINKIYFTTDDGLSWDSTAVIDPSLDFIEALYCSSDRLYAGTVVDGVFSSGDGGHSWQADNTGLTGLGAQAISGLEARGDSLYAGTYGSGVFVKNTATNSPWSDFNTGMPWTNIESLTCLEGVLWAGAGSNNTVSRQAPPGYTWTETPFAPLDGTQNAFLGVTRHGDALLAAGNWLLYRSTDEGVSWTPYDAGTGYLSSARFVSVGQRVYAHLAKPVGASFIKYSDDEGLSWQSLATPPGYGYDLIYHGGWLYTAHDNGLWRAAFSTPVEEPPAETAALDQNFPNPFAEKTTIPVSLTRNSWIELGIYDARGSLVRLLWRGEKPAGIHHFAFEAADLPPGRYICRLATENATLARWIARAK